MDEVITEIPQITPAWLTQVLSQGGHLPHGKVTTIEIAPRSQPFSTWFANSTYLVIHYNRDAPPTAPKRLFLKLSKAELPEEDQIYGEREVFFYTHLAPQMPDSPLAQCYHAAFDPETGKSHLLLQDLSDTHFQPDHTRPPTEQDRQGVVASLAHFHAYVWQHPLLGTNLVKESQIATSNQEAPCLLHTQSETTGMFPAFVDFMKERLAEETRRVYEKLLSDWPFSGWSDRITSGRGITLIHHDAHPWNFLYPLNPDKDRVYIIDWHEWGVGIGAIDLAEFLILGWEGAHEGGQREMAVRWYHDRLIAQGVTHYPWEQCWHDYRLAALRILLYPIWMLTEGRPQSFWLPIFESGLQAFHTLGCVELLT